MKQKFAATIVLAALFGWPCSAAEHNAKLVRSIFPGHSCVYFTLQGVNVADSAVSNSPWFVLSPAHPLFKENYAALLAARASQDTVDIGTTGTASSVCPGYVEISYIVLGQ